jgi:hypothetical protein
MTAMTGESWHLEASYNSRTIWGATSPKVYSPESLQNAVYRQLAVRRGLSVRPVPGRLCRCEIYLAGSPDAAAVTVIAISLRGGAVPCLLPADLAFDRALLRKRLRMPMR